MRKEKKLDKQTGVQYTPTDQQTSIVVISISLWYMCVCLCDFVDQTADTSYVVLC
jgi:hypothetical protein